MQRSILFSALMLTSALCADGDLVAASHKMSSQPQQPMNDNQQNQSQMMNVVTLTSARPASDNGWYLFADALYWHADVGATDWANVLSTPNLGSDTFTIEKNHSLNFKWDWGFRVGIGANIDHDMWDTNFYYTWFFTDNSNAAGGVRVTDEIGVASDLAGDRTTAKIHWGIHFSMFDWELGRWHYVSKSLALRPHVGVKGGWIDQDINVRFKNPEGTRPVVRGKLENDFWGVGPSVGINTMWILGNAGKSMEHRFSLIGDFGGALMYGHFDVKDKAKVFGRGGVETGSVKRNGLTRNLAVTMLQGFMGLSWDTPFNHDKNHFMLKAGYELQYWFRQNQLVWTTDGTKNRRISDDLALQGVTVDLRFDF